MKKYSTTQALHTWCLHGVATKVTQYQTNRHDSTNEKETFQSNTGRMAFQNVSFG